MSDWINETIDSVDAIQSQAVFIKQLKKDYDEVMKERDALKSQLSACEGELKTNQTGFEEKSEAWRYRKIHAAVEQMGGFANFESWVNEHAKDYFESLEKSIILLGDSYNMLQEHGVDHREARDFFSRFLDPAKEKKND